MFDLAILGGGPAGVSAAVYAARKKLNTIFITKDFGGQSIVSEGIENWIGDKNIPGAELAKRFENHVRNYENDIDIKTGEWIKDVRKIEGGYEIETDKGSYQSKTILVATGSHRKRLEAENADVFEHKGVTYCASCDGPLFTGKDVIVVGGGNAGFETASQLLAYTNSVTLVHHRDKVKADPVTVEAITKNPKMNLVLNAEIKKVVGDKFVEGIIYTDKESGEEKEIKASGIFVEIGSVPTTEFVSKIVPLDEYNRIKIDPWTQRTEEDGVWAAGDCTNIRYHQNNIAAGDAVRALEDIYLEVQKLK